MGAWRGAGLTRRKRHITGETTLRQMLMTGTIGFRKMNGLGNDFVVLDARAQKLALSPEVVQAIADRKEGIGCDQLIALEPSDEADLFMRIWNADGGEVGACGNAARCVAALIAGEQGRSQVSIGTESGVLGAVVNDDGSVTIDMGAPRFAWDEIPLAAPVPDTQHVEIEGASGLTPAAMVNVGNPHCLFFVDDIDVYDLARLGPALERHPLFPDRANISLVQIIGPDHLKVRTWERGAGLTRACGTAACASAIAAARRKLVGRKVIVTLPGGDLLIEWRESDGHVLMTGPYALDYEGTLPAELLRS